jgi:hypothetical protein
MSWMTGKRERLMNWTVAVEITSVCHASPKHMLDLLHNIASSLWTLKPKNHTHSSMHDMHGSLIHHKTMEPKTVSFQIIAHYHFAL